MRPTPIGTTKGPGETPHEFTFVAPDPEQRVKYGEFVYYEVEADGRITRILADQALAPRLTRHLHGRPASPRPWALLAFSRPRKLYEIAATILGYYDPALGFVNPRVPPRARSPIYIADGSWPGACRRGRRVGSVRIGSLWPARRRRARRADAAVHQHARP